MMNIYMNIIDICIYIYIDREREYYIHGTIYIYFIFIYLLYISIVFSVFFKKFTIMVRNPLCLGWY